VVRPRTPSEDDMVQLHFPSETPLLKVRFRD
jgi:hypothetical protein